MPRTQPPEIRQIRHDDASYGHKGPVPHSQQRSFFSLQTQSQQQKKTKKKAKKKTKKKTKKKSKKKPKKKAN